MRIWFAIQGVRLATWLCGRSLRLVPPVARSPQTRVVLQRLADHYVPTDHDRAVATFVAQHDQPIIVVNRQACAVRKTVVGQC